MSRQLQPCGTVAAYSRHIKRGETPCDACRAANREYKRGGPPRPLQPCGTYAAYARHRRNGEEACEPCNAARSSHPANVVNGRAHSRANTAMRRRYRPEYRAELDRQIAAGESTSTAQARALAAVRDAHYVEFLDVLAEMRAQVRAELEAQS